MPELPEVETVRRTLEGLIAGRRLEHFASRDPLVTISPETAFADLVGKTLTAVERRGKYLLLWFEGGTLLVVHLRMSGRFCRAETGSPLHVHDRVVLRFADVAGEVRYRDPRRFGKFLVEPTGRLEAVPGVRSLGVEPLDVSVEAFTKLLRGRRVIAKNTLLRQDIIAGLGNIYVDESLFGAGIHPQQDLSALGPKHFRDLHQSMVAILGAAIEAGGSTIADFSDALGLAGSYQKVHRVYGKAGEPCPRCSTPIRKMKVAGRGTHFCPVCQKKKRGRSRPRS